MAMAAKNQRLSGSDYQTAWAELRDEVRARYRIDMALADMFNLNLPGSGDSRSACCPFHVEKTPSFHVSISRGRYRCFGSGCEESGDVFKLIMTTQNLGFREAVLWGADKAGVMVPDDLRRLRAPVSSVRRAPRPVEPINPIHQVPLGLKPTDFNVVEHRMRRPHAGQPFRMWKNGGRNGDKERKTVFYRPEMVHEYRDTSNNILMYVLRLRFNDGRKFFIPARLMELEAGKGDYVTEKKLDNGKVLVWVNEGPVEGSLKPIYGAHRATAWERAGGQEILIVEGEKTCDVADAMISETDPDGNWLVASPMGGSSATIYADWRGIIEAAGDRPVRVTIWPDADKPLLKRDGTTVDRVEKYVHQLSTSFMQAVLDAGKDPAQFTLRSVIPPVGVDSGWDIADAKTDGWSPERIRNYIQMNHTGVKHDMLNLRAAAANDIIETEVELSGEGGPAFASPFDEDGRLSQADDDAIWAEIVMSGSSQEGDPEFQSSEVVVGGADHDPANNEDVLAALGIDAETAIESVQSVAVDAPAPVEEGIIDDGDDGSGIPAENPILANPYFRCLGYHERVDYFISLTSGQIFDLAPRQFKAEYLLHLAPLEWWQENYGQVGQRGLAIDWTRAANDLIQNCYAAGIWDPRMSVAQGARLDGRKVVFNTGSRLYVEGRDGTSPLWDFQGRYCYVMGPSARTPAFDAPFEAEARELYDFLDIIRKIDWRQGTSELSIMSLFGWIMISPICGILKWRPHLWLDGPRSSGKSWIVNNIVLPALGDYAIQVVSNSTESGIRTLANRRSIPIVIDEMEGEGQADRNRVDQILRAARHSATESNSVVAQGVSGGGGAREFSLSSTFLMTSIMPQLEAAADKTRFARARLGTGRGYEKFTADIEGPAYKLLQEPSIVNGIEYSFSDRLVARMVMRGGDYMKVYRIMVEALSRMGYERRIADVYGSFAAGAWLAFRDDVPEFVEDAVCWMADTFDVIHQIRDVNEDLQEEKDHLRVFREIAAQEWRVDTRNSGARTFQLGDLILVASGKDMADDVLISIEEARDILQKVGIKPGDGDDLCPIEGQATTLLVHRNSPTLRKMMDSTPYARSFIDVMHQANDVRIGKKSHRFGAALSTPTRPLVVPIDYFI